MFFLSSVGSTFFVKMFRKKSAFHTKTDMTGFSLNWLGLLMVERRVRRSTLLIECGELLVVER